MLRDTTMAPAVERAQGGEKAARTFFERHGDIALFEFRQLDRLASAPGPKFVFAHILLPHDPYVFRPDGSRYTEEEVRPHGRGGALRRAAGVPEPADQGPRRAAHRPETTTSDPIIILQGDEGPLACRSVDCVGRRPALLPHPLREPERDVPAGRGRARCPTTSRR